MKKALITGITGQDGSYLVELLLKKGYEVHGLRRMTSIGNTERIDHLLENHASKKNKLILHYGDLTDSSSLNRLLENVVPDEIYNLGAQSHAHHSFRIPEYTAETNGIGVLRILNAIKETGIKSKFYQASTSELFGNAEESPQNENTKFHPRSPYGVAKLFAYWTVRNYREDFGVFACNGIMYNHESPRRGTMYVTRKITSEVARIKKGIQKKMYIGNLEARRDWGYSRDYVEAMWLMLQQDKPDDYVISTGETHSVRELCEAAFEAPGINIVWKGKGIKEKGIDKKTGKTIIEIDQEFYKPAETFQLVGDYSKAKKQLGWRPKTSFRELIKMMVEHDLEK